MVFAPADVRAVVAGVAPPRELAKRATQCSALFFHADGQQRRQQQRPGVVPSGDDQLAPPRAADVRPAGHHPRAVAQKVGTSGKQSPSVVALGWSPPQSSPPPPRFPVSPSHEHQPPRQDVTTASTADLAVVADASSTSSTSSNAEFFSNILRTNPLFRKVNSNIQDMHEKWETSDSPLVHRIQDAIDDSFLVQESEAQIASKLIQQRHPGFDMVAFLRGLKEDVPIVIRAYLSGDERVIGEYCSPEMVERLTGIIKHQKEQGLVPDPTLLDTSEVELVDLKMLDDNPVVVAQFTCQQINCTRDTHGNVVEGGEEDVQRIYYYWALQMEEQPYVGEDDRVHPPRWRLREMLIRGMHNLL